MLKKIFLIPCLLSLLSCASYFKRQSCEATNWFRYGEKVALEGRRLTGDQFVTECYKADADVAESDLDRGFKSGMEKYCLPETALQNGKSGNFFNEEMCVGQGLNNLRIQHHAGVLQYCDKSNGYSAGAKGNEYNKICPADLEKVFLPEFNRGRKSYLKTVISQNSQQIIELNSQIGRLSSEATYTRGLLAGMQTRASHLQNGGEFAPQINKLNSEVIGLENQIRSATQKQNALKEKNRQYELEIVQLGE